MEHISNSLSKVIQEHPESTAYLATLNKKLNQEEHKMITLKYQSKAFGKMNWDEVDTWAQALLVKINVITGWIVPDDTLEILVDQFRKKLVESYPNCNPDEIEYAFRNFGTAVKDWGKQMNLSLIDEVLGPYLSKRYEASRLEEQMVPLPQIEYKEDMSDEAMNDWFNDVSKKVRAGEMKVDFISPMLYEWLNDRGGITATKEQKYEYLQRAADYRLGQLQREHEESDNQATRWRLSNFVTMKNAGCIEGQEAGTVKELAKKICLFETILNMPVQA